MDFLTSLQPALTLHTVVLRGEEHNSKYSNWAKKSIESHCSPEQTHCKANKSNTNMHDPNCSKNGNNCIFESVHCCIYFELLQLHYSVYNILFFLPLFPHFSTSVYIHNTAYCHMRIPTG